MAFTMYSEEQDEFGYLVETVWGTPNADAALFNKIKFPKGTKVEIPVVNTDLGLNRAARQADATDIYTDNYSGPVRITVAEFLLERSHVANLVYACLQNKVSEGVTPFAKVFKVHVSQPDFTANAGYFFTLAWKKPVASKHYKITSCIVKELNFVFDKSATGDANLVKVSCVILGKKHALSSNFTGTWVEQGTNYFTAHDFTYKYNDATAMEWQSFSLRLDNGAEPLDKDSDGTPKTFFLNWPPMGQSAEAEHWYNANTTGTIVDLAADHNAGTTRLYSIINSIAVGTLGNLKFAFYSKLNAPPSGTNNKQMTTPVSHLLIHNSISTNDLLIVSLSDGVDQTP